MKSTAMAAFLLAALFLAGVSLAQESDKPPVPGNGQAKPAEGEAKPAEGEAKPAEGEAKPAEGEAKPAEGAAKPAEGEAKPAEGAAKPAEGAAKPAEGAAKPAETPAKPGDSGKVESPFKTARGYDLFKFKISDKGKADFTFTDSSKYTTKGGCDLEIKRTKTDGKNSWLIDLLGGHVSGVCARGRIIWHFADFQVFGLDTKAEFDCTADGKGRIENTGEGKLGAAGLGMLIELRHAQIVDLSKGIASPAECKGDVGVICDGKVDLLKPGCSLPGIAGKGSSYEDHSICKKLVSPDFLKDLFDVDTGEEGSVELLLKDGGRIYTPEESETKFNVSFIERSPRDTILTLLAGAFSFDLGPDLVTVEIPKTMSVTARNAVYKISSDSGKHRIESLGGERIVAVTAKELLASLRLTLQIDPKSAVDTSVDQASGDVVFSVDRQSQKPVSFSVSVPGKGALRSRRRFSPLPGLR